MRFHFSMYINMNECGYGPIKQRDDLVYVVYNGQASWPVDKINNIVFAGVNNIYKIAFVITELDFLNLFQ